MFERAVVDVTAVSEDIRLADLNVLPCSLDIEHQWMLSYLPMKPGMVSLCSAPPIKAVQADV